MRSLPWITLVAACSAPSSAIDDSASLTDVRVPLPPSDSTFVDLVTPEFTIEPGDETIYCHYLDNPAGTFATDRIETLGGTGQHHLAFRRATQRRPSGTFEDCTSTQEELGLGDLFLGGGPLPTGWAVELAASEQFVIETHYLNATDLPLLARDVIRLHRADPAQVTKWVHPMHLKTYDLVVAPGTSTLAFDCTVPSSVSLYEVWGHQHAAGTRQTVTMTRPGEQTTMLYAATWGVDPLIQGRVATAIDVPANTQLRVTCTWTNATGREITYPDEMCAFGGYVEGAELSCIGDTFVP